MAEPIHALADVAPADITPTQDEIDRNLALATESLPASGKGSSRALVEKRLAQSMARIWLRDHGIPYPGMPDRAPDPPRRELPPPPAKPEVERKIRIRDAYGKETTRAYGRRPVLTRGDQITERAKEWLWYGRFALGKPHLLSGMPGDGKSTIATDISARVTSGRSWPDGSGNAHRGNVIVMSGEEEPEDELVPRLRMHGADLSQIRFLSMTRDTEGDEQEFNLIHDLPALEEAIVTTGNVRFVYIDPVTDFISGANENANKDVRPMLRSLGRLAARYRFCLLLVIHLNKGVGTNAVYRSAGATAFIGRSRSAWLVARDRRDPDRCLMLSSKINIGARPSGLAYRVDADGILRWEDGPVAMRADDALIDTMTGGQVLPLKGPEPRTLEAAIEWLIARLADGAELQADLVKAASDVGIGKGSFFRAKEAIRLSEFGEGRRKMLALPEDLLDSEEGDDAPENE